MIHNAVNGMLHNAGFCVTRGRTPTSNVTNAVTLAIFIIFMSTFPQPPESLKKKYLLSRTTGQDRLKDTILDTIIWLRAGLLVCVDCAVVGLEVFQ